MAITALATMAGFLLLRHRTSTAMRVAVVAVAVLALGTTTLARNREYASELTLAESTLRHWPSDVAHGMVGSALGHVGRHEEAVEELRLAARTDARSRFNLGVELYNVKRFDEAVRELERFAGENPMLDLVPAARRIVGDVFAIQRKWREAANQYRVALSMIPQDAGTRQKLAAALNGQALALVDAGKLDEAIATFRSAVEWDSANWSARHNLAAALLDAHDAAAAETEARRAVQTNPGDAGSYDLLGRALAIQRKYDEAIVQLQEALKLAPGDAQIQEDLRRVMAVK
jgi:tetratricopeptide (TPR) repeat protein